MAITNSTLKLNPGLTVKTLALQDGRRCAIVDDFLRDPQRAVAYARDHAAELSRPLRSYPGMILRIGPDLLSEVYRFIRSSMSRHFAFLRGDIKYSAYFGMTTLQPQDFIWQQRLCHVDPRVEVGRDNYAAPV